MKPNFQLKIDRRMKKTFKIKIAVVLLAVHLIKLSDSLFKATNIKCKCYDKSFCDFTQCELKVLGRGKIGIFIYVKAHQLPVKQVLVNFSLHRKFSGYRPFLYNITVDFCEYLRNPKRSPWFNIAYQALNKFTNLNHSCPYNHDIIVSKLVLNDAMLEKTPFPTGSYMFQVIVGNPKWQGITQVMVDIVNN